MLNAAFSFLCISKYNPAKGPLLFRERGTIPRKLPEKKKSARQPAECDHILLRLGKRGPFHPILRSKIRKYIKKERALYQNARSNMER